MKSIIFFFIAISHITVAQTVDYNQIIPSSSNPNLELSEKLVVLAWMNNPQNEVVRREFNIAQVELTQAKWSWLDIVSLNGNLNEYTINPSEQLNDGIGRLNQYPRYNVGARINLSIFSDKPAEIKKSREQIEIAEANINTQKLAIRAAVLTAYQNYLMYEELLQLQIESTEDAYSSHALAEQQFQNGNLTLEEYTMSLNNYNVARKARIVAENDLMNSKIALENLIGVPIESVK